jgi:hypothetical protein
MIYLTLEDWINFFIPKLNDDTLFVEEFKQTKKIHNILIELITLIFPNKNYSENRLKQRILYASMIYYYKYILYRGFSHSNISEIEKVLICSSCIFLSFKEAGKQININFLSETLLPYLNNNSKNKKFLLEDTNSFIKKYEYDILNSIGFNMGIDNPYDFLKYLKFYLKNISIESNTIEEIIQLVNKIINESLLFPLYLYYSSYDIALSCILLAKERNNYHFINIDNFIQMNQLQINKNNICQCAKYISKISNFLIKNSSPDDNIKNEIKNNNQKIPEDNAGNEIKNNNQIIPEDNAAGNQIKNNNQIIPGNNTQHEIIINIIEIPEDNIENEINFNAIANIHTNQM